MHLANISWVPTAMMSIMPNFRDIVANNAKFLLYGPYILMGKEVWKWMTKILYMFILNIAEKPKAKYSKARDTSVEIGNCSFLFGCHWYNDKWAETLNKWRVFQIDERVYTKDLRLGGETS